MCTIADVCLNSGACRGVFGCHCVSDEECNDLNDCTVDRCTGERCVNEPSESLSGVSCDDGDPCTSSSVCNANGECVASLSSDEIECANQCSSIGGDCCLSKCECRTPAFVGRFCDVEVEWRPLSRIYAGCSDGEDCITNRFYAKKAAATNKKTASVFTVEHVSLGIGVADGYGQLRQSFGAYGVAGELNSSSTTTPTFAVNFLDRKDDHRLLDGDDVRGWHETLLVWFAKKVDVRAIRVHGRDSGGGGAEIRFYTSPPRVLLGSQLFNLLRDYYTRKIMTTTTTAMSRRKREEDYYDDDYLLDIFLISPDVNAFGTEMLDIEGNGEGVLDLSTPLSARCIAISHRWGSGLSLTEVVIIRPTFNDSTTLGVDNDGGDEDDDGAVADVEEQSLSTTAIVLISVCACVCCMLLLGLVVQVFVHNRRGRQRRRRRGTQSSSSSSASSSEEETNTSVIAETANAKTATNADGSDYTPISFIPHHIELQSKEERNRKKTHAKTTLASFALIWKAREIIDARRATGDLIYIRRQGEYIVQEQDTNSLVNMVFGKGRKIYIRKKRGDGYDEQGSQTHHYEWFNLISESHAYMKEAEETSAKHKEALGQTDSMVNSNASYGNTEPLTKPTTAAEKALKEHTQALGQSNAKSANNNDGYYGRTELYAKPHTAEGEALKVHTQALGQHRAVAAGQVIDQSQAYGMTSLYVKRTHVGDNDANDDDEVEYIRFHTRFGKVAEDPGDRRTREMKRRDGSPQISNLRLDDVYSRLQISSSSSTTLPSAETDSHDVLQQSSKASSTYDNVPLFVAKKTVEGPLRRSRNTSRRQSLRLSPRSPRSTLSPCAQNHSGSRTPRSRRTNRSSSRQSRKLNNQLNADRTIVDEEMRHLNYDISALLKMGTKDQHEEK